MRVLVVEELEDRIAAYLKQLSKLPQVKEVCVVRDLESAEQFIDDEDGWSLVAIGGLPWATNICSVIVTLDKPKLPKLVVLHGDNGGESAKCLKILWTTKDVYVRAVASPFDRRLSWLPGMLAVKTR